MTNHWIDLRNADRIMIIGSNAAENHPISFKWVTAAKERGAKLISVDPRFTRTSSKADIFAPMRSGTDITFIGGMIRYILDDMQKLGPGNRGSKYNWTYVTQYTNATLIIKDIFENAFKATHQGVFSGYTDKSDDATNPAPSTLGVYDKTSWGYADGVRPDVDAALVNDTWNDWDDLDDRTVLRLLWENYEKYTP